MKSFSALALLASLPFFLSGKAQATTTSINTGSLGATANGTNSNSVTLGTPGAVSAGGDQSVGYPAGGGNTTIPFLAALNPSAGSSFSIEFWANPSASDNDDAIVSNRFTAGANRSGWIFFQRAAGTGWNFRMYNGVGSGLGWDLTGGTSNLNTWNHVVATWNGSAALLYVNGILADSTNDGAATGVYNPNTLANSPIFSIGANADVSSATTSLADEVAFYNSALTPAQILNHFTLASSPTAGTYYGAVLADGATLQLSNAPEPSSVLFLGLGGLALLRRRARA
ncbi:MAG TPA: LamG domain-containing protein [Verrucomicrobiales bacterium]|nr:LamG domain-containing protein [Verrucomicrobiales bacterium]